MKNGTIQTMAIALAALMSLWGISMVVDGTQRLRATLGTDQKQQQTLEAFELVDRALAPSAPTQFFSYKGTFESPFLVPRQHVVRRRTTPAQSKVRIKLALKGVLMKESPLAIISDEHGKTFICKQGDIVHDQKILAIHADKVDMRFGSSRYSLKVPER